MALTTCLDCGREISSLAASCIHCGRPAEQRAAVLPVPVVAASPSCPFCTADVTHPNSRTGGKAWCERCGAQLIYGTDGALVRALPREALAQQPVRPVVIVGERKSVGLSILLSFFFGPLGMLYSTVQGAMVMFLVTVLVAAFTFGIGLFVTWPVGVIWAASAASEHNRRLAFGLPVVA
jgi:hypothetical protein